MSFHALSAVVATAARSAGASTHADVTDANGKNAKTIASDKNPIAMTLVLNAIDWR